MNCIKTQVIFVLCLFSLLSCGIDDYYYLPQLSEGRITSQFNTKAEINIPSNFFSQNQAAYASGFAIFYKIYISNLDINAVNDINNYRDSNIYMDYSSLYQFTDPSNTTSITSLTTFSSRGFYELELEGIDIRSTVLSTGGGSFIIQFPTVFGDKPFITYSGNNYSLLRSNDRGVFNPKPDKYFRNSDDLRDYANAISTINADVSGLPSSVNAQTKAYASMYIVAVGQNPRNFTRLYSKPTHINIFLLPQMN
jgi:hypothetical protein